jgi:hypothetical protein
VQKLYAGIWSILLFLYQWLDKQLVGPYAIGDNVTLLDAYIVLIENDILTAQNAN